MVATHVEQPAGCRTGRPPSSHHLVYQRDPQHLAIRIDSTFDFGKTRPQGEEKLGGKVNL